MHRILVLSVGANVVGRAVDQKGIRPALGVFGHIDRGEEPLAVAHGNAELVLGVVGADVVLFGRNRRGRLLRGKNRQSEANTARMAKKKRNRFIICGNHLLNNQITPAGPGDWLGGWK